MENNNYVSVGNIIEQERLKRQAQIAKGVNLDVYDHIEKAHQDDLNYNIEKSDNLTRFETDIQDLNKAETELLLHKIQRQLNADSQSMLLKAMKSIAVNHYNDIEKARHGIYEDNAENRRLNRVGQEYGHAAERKEPINKQPKKQEEAGVGIQSHAAKASDKALKHAAADENAKPEVREAAKKELGKRNDVFNKIGKNFYSYVSDDGMSHLKEYIQAAADGINKTGEKKEIVIDKNKNIDNKEFTTFDKPELKGIKIYDNGSTVTLEYKGKTKVLYPNYKDFEKERKNVMLDIIREMSRRTGVPFERYGSDDIMPLIKTKKDYKKWFGTTDGYDEFKNDIKKIEYEIRSIMSDFNKQNTDMSDYFNGEGLSEYSVDYLHDWKKRIDSEQGGIPYVEKEDVEELLGGYYTYISGEDEYDHHTGVGGYDYKAIKKKLKDSVQKYGSLKVATSIVDAAIGADSGQGVIQNKDEAKCELSGIFDDWKIKTDKETKKYLEYNKDNVWWA